MKNTLTKIITAITLTVISLVSIGCSEGCSDRGSNFNIFPDPWSGPNIDEQRKINNNGMVWHSLFPAER